MAAPSLVSVRDFTTSRYTQVAENTEGLLPDILARAEEAIQSRLGRRLGVSAYIETFRANSNTLFVLNRPIQSVTQIRRRPSVLHGWELVNLTYTRFESAAGYIECFPAYSSVVAGYDVEVSYTAGYPILPEELREAILMQAVMFSTQDLEVYGSGDSRAPGYVKYFYEDIDRLLKPHRATASVFH